VLVVLVVGLIVYWIFFLNKDKDIPILTIPVESDTREQKIEINFDKLENELLKQLAPFEFISMDISEDLGRDNPFAPSEVTE